ncbi:hypothetical protein KIW84_056004 [Lathyrus oleraceus]|uniref:Uncharacterized protein n=1 Tax=Pisum sativum TaxID=3888 RepID=A0A9D4WZ71_PEA|nr:hypothetical protein KIW84_056004 [Pisum sativum]
MNVGNIDGPNHGQGSKPSSISCDGSQSPLTSMSTSIGGSTFGSSRGDLLRRLTTFSPLNWLDKPQVGV